MSVIVEGGTIRLVGLCPVEDAEPLLSALQDDPTRAVDVSGLESAHFAVIQLLTLFAATVEGEFPDPFLRTLCLQSLATGAGRANPV
ncbi:hypothetical protein [Novosphingobium lindaniclasticum]|uniref:STAS domain-containing protein n=1 Tax=Novosphingobium lindaniclasticum LE124 TaxID=1096930 RepID=T0I7M3_9SPHN|nr:hypothetical protein [Novosphingobium lindaniclasticum]EQB07690.1 hypothetical protein L284_22790 [Novosphingobium lindaniclasticum LE124]